MNAVLTSCLYLSPATNFKSSPVIGVIFQLISGNVDKLSNPGGTLLNIESHFCLECVNLFLSNMDKLSNVVIKPLQDSIYMKPLTMCFKQNGRDRTWDLLQVHDSVAIMIYNKTRDVLVLVKQFRPAVYFGSISENDRRGGVIDVQKYPASLGITLEACAGIIDKKLPIEEIAREEMLEECGYDVPIGYLKKIASYRSGVGTTGSIQTAFYCEVTDDMKVNSGGGVDDEIIDVVEMTVSEIKEYVQQDHILSPPSFLFLIYWFLNNKAT